MIIDYVKTIQSLSYPEQGNEVEYEVLTKTALDALRYFQSNLEELQSKPDVSECLDLIKRIGLIKNESKLRKEIKHRWERCFSAIHTETVKLDLSDGRYVELNSLDLEKFKDDSEYVKKLFSGNFASEYRLKLSLEDFSNILVWIQSDGEILSQQIYEDGIRYLELADYLCLDSLKIKIAQEIALNIPKELSLDTLFTLAKVARLVPSNHPVQQKFSNYFNRYLATLGSFDEIDRFLGDNPELKNSIYDLDTYIFRNFSSDQLPKLIKLFPHLIKIKVSPVNMEKAVLQAIASQKELQVLDLNRCWNFIDDDLSDLIKELTNLQELDLSNCKHLKGTCLFHLKELKNLKKLNLSYCEQLAEIDFDFENLEVRFDRYGSDIATD